MQKKTKKKKNWIRADYALLRETNASYKKHIEILTNNFLEIEKKHKKQIEDMTALKKEKNERLFKRIKKMQAKKD